LQVTAKKVIKGRGLLPFLLFVPDIAEVRHILVVHLKQPRAIA